MKRVPAISRRRFIAAAAAAVAALRDGAAHAQETGLVEAARAEGKLVVYGDSNALPVLIEGFRKTYPGISVTSATGGGWQMYNRYLTERQAGQTVVDVLYTSEDAMIVAQAQGDLLKVRPREFDELVAGAAPKERHFALANGQLCIPLYNREDIKEAEAPKDWSDFANPPQRWQNLISVPDPRNSSALFSVLAALRQDLGIDAATAILRGLRKSGVEMTPNLGITMTKLQNRERPIAFFGHTGFLAQVLDSGAPVNLVIPTAGAVAQYSAIGVPRDAPRPAAARLFMGYALSEDGQKRLAAGRMYPTRKGVASPAGFPAMDSVKLMPIDLAAAVAEQKDIIAWWQKEMGVR